MKNIIAMIMNPILIIFISLVMTTLVTADKFDIYDSNHDGKLDRIEYGAMSKELRSVVEPFFVEATAQAGAASSFPWEHLSGEDFASGVFNSLVVIIGEGKIHTMSYFVTRYSCPVTEIGDKTFFIAAVLAMRNGRMIVYLGCMGKCDSLDEILLMFVKLLWR